MKRTVTLSIAGITLISSIAFAGNYAVVTSPEQDVAIQQAMKAKRGAFAGQDDKHLVQLMFDRGIKGYQLFLNRKGFNPQPASQPKAD